MTDLIATARDLQTFCEEQHWQFCFIGGLAVQALAEARLTNDTDMTLLTGFGGEEAYIDTLLSRYRPRRPDARAFALLHRVLLLQAWGDETYPIDEHGCPVADPGSILGTDFQEPPQMSPNGTHQSF